MSGEFGKTMGELMVEEALRQAIYMRWIKRLVLVDSLLLIACLVKYLIA
jgi:hypothetical protein